MEDKVNGGHCDVISAGIVLVGMHIHPVDSAKVLPKRKSGRPSCQNNSYG
jgi:hypothetical protein